MKNSFFVLCCCSFFLLSSCELSSNFFSAQILDNEISAIHPATIETKGTKIKIILQEGTSLVSLPFFPEEESSIILKSPAIKNIWQKEKTENIQTLSAFDSYFIEAKESISFEWKKTEEEIYNSTLLEAGKNLPAIYKGEDTFFLKDININGKALSEANLQNIFEYFYIFDSNYSLRNLVTENISPETQILFGTGVFIEAKAFSKISWPLSEKMEVEQKKAEEKQQKALEKMEEKKQKEQDRYQKKIEKDLNKIDEASRKKIFEETSSFPESFLQAIQKEDTEFLHDFIAEKLLLAQVHDYSTILEHQTSLETEIWLKNKELWDRPFRLLDGKEFQLMNSQNRSIFFIEFPYTQEEIMQSSEAGISSFFQAFAVIRGQDCSWKFDPIETMIIQEKLKKSTNLYTEKQLEDSNILKEIELIENTDFQSSRKQCQEESEDMFSLKKGKFQIVETENTEKKTDNKLLKDHEKNCQSLGKILESMDMKTLESFVYNNEDEKKISGTKFPNLSFYEDICKDYWPQLIGHENFNDILQGTYEGEDAVANFIVDDSFYLFLGINKQFNCKSLEGGEKDYCYFGAALPRTSSSFCNKIESTSVQLFCAGYIAQKKKKYSYCEKVFGTYDKKQDKDTVKEVALRNCKLDMLIATAKTKKDCKELKTPFFLFFSRSNPSYETCLQTVSGDLDTGQKKEHLKEEQILEEMGIVDKELLEE